MANNNNSQDNDPDIPHSGFFVRNWKDAIYRFGPKRPDTDSLHLNKTDIDNIFGNSDTYDEFDQEDVDEAIANIEKRLMRLLYDIAVLSSGDHLDDIDKIWDYLEDSPSHMNLALRNAISRDTTANDSDYCFDLGFNTGLAFSEITGTVGEDKRGSRFLEGFEDAYSTGMSKNHHELIEDLSPTKEMIKNVEEPPEEVANTPSDLTRINSSESDQITTQKEVLAKNNICPTNYIQREITYYKTALNNIQSMPDLSLGEATERFLEDTADWFEKCCEIRGLLDEEWESIDDAVDNVPGPDLHNVLESVWSLSFRQNINDITPSNICSESVEKNTYKKSVTQILNRLSKNGNSPSKRAKTTYKHGEIVSYDQNNDWWDLTDYGRLLFYHVFEKNQDPQWIQIASLQNEVVAEQFIPWSDEDVEIIKKGTNHYFEE